MAGDRSSQTNTKKHLRRGAVVLGAIVALVGATALPTNAQEPEPNFAFSGVNPSNQKPIAISEVVTASKFQFCENANGLGSEAYLEATAPSGLYIQHATVSPMVVPVHLGVIEVNNPNPDSAVSGELVTLGVVEGTTVDFGNNGPASADYGGVAWSDEATGVISWSYAGDANCETSLAKPIIDPMLPTTTAGP